MEHGMIPSDPGNGRNYSAERKERLEMSNLNQDAANDLLADAMNPINEERVKIALEAGADPNIRFDPTWWTLPLHKAIWDRKHRDEEHGLLCDRVLHLLMQFGADPYASARDKDSALGTAIHDYSLHVAEILLRDYGVHPDFAGMDDGQPIPSLWKALKRHRYHSSSFVDGPSSEPVFRLLLKYGANINCMFNGRTILMEAAGTMMRDLSEVTSIMFEHGIDPMPTIGDENPRDAEQIARDYHNFGLAERIAVYKAAWQSKLLAAASPTGIPSRDQIGQLFAPAEPSDVIDVEFTVHPQPASIDHKPNAYWNLVTEMTDTHLGAAFRTHGTLDAYQKHVLNIVGRSAESLSHALFAALSRGFQEIAETAMSPSEVTEKLCTVIRAIIRTADINPKWMKAGQALLTNGIPEEVHHHMPSLDEVEERLLEHARCPELVQQVLSLPCTEQLFGKTERNPITPMEYTKMMRDYNNPYIRDGAEHVMLILEEHLTG